MTTLYIDSSALVKRVADESDSDALVEALEDRISGGAVIVTSALARVEVSRALRVRLDELPPSEVMAAASEALTGVATAPIADLVIEHARIIGPPVLPSLDAIHLATAVSVSADELWTYDERLARASEELGIPVRAPTLADRQ